MAEETPSPSTPMSQSENAPVAYYGDNSNGATAGLLGALALAKPESYDGIGMIGAYNGSSLRYEVGEVNRTVKDAECNIRHDVKDSESNVRRDVAKESGDIRENILREGQENMAATKDAECHVSKEVLETRHTLAKDILRAEYEAKLGAQQTIKEVNQHSSHLAERTQDRLDAFERRSEQKFERVDDKFTRVDDKFCAFERRNDDHFNALSKQIEECCCDLKISSLETQLKGAEQTGLVNAIVNALNVTGGPGNSVR